MRWLAAPLLLLMACTQPSPCEVRGGQCTRSDVDCSPTQEFIGFDSSCGVNDKCCLPLPAVPDGGVTCDDRHGQCLSVSGKCPGTSLQVQGSCPLNPGDTCCAGFTTDAGP